MLIPGYSGRKLRHRAIWRTGIILFLGLFCFLYGLVFAFFAPFLLPIFLIPPIILGLVVIWALPDERTAPTRTLNFLFFAFSIALIVWPNYLAVALPGLPWITLIRLFAFPLALIFVVCLSTSKDFRSKLYGSINSTPLLWKLLVCFVAIQFFSIAMSHNKGDSIQKFIIDQVYWTSAFFVSAYLFLKPGRIEKWSALNWILAIIVCAIAILEYRARSILWAGHIPSFLKIEDPSVQRILAGHMRAGTNEYRAQSTFGTSLGLSEYLALIVPFVITFISRNYHLIVRLVAVISIPLMVTVVILTDSRLGVVGCFLTFLIYTLVISGRVWLQNRRSILGPAIVITYPIMFAATVAMTFVVGHIRRHVWGTGAQQASTEARYAQYNMGLPKVWHNPLGHGVGMGADTLGYFTPDGTLTIDAYYLAIALEYGVLGFIVYFGMIGMGVYAAGWEAIFRKDADRDRSFLLPLAISLLNFFVIKSVFSQQDNHPLIFIMLGAVSALVYRGNLAQMHKNDVNKAPLPPGVEPARHAAAVREARGPA